MIFRFSQVDQAAISAALQTLSTGTTFDAAFRDYNSTFVFATPLLPALTPSPRRPRSTTA